MKKIVFTDLDDTLVVSERRFEQLCHNTDKIKFNWKGLLMTQKQLDLYQFLCQCDDFIVVTARDLANFTLLRSHFLSEGLDLGNIAILNYGTHILTYDEDKDKLSLDLNYENYQKTHLNGVDMDVELLKIKTLLEESGRGFVIKDKFDIGKRCYIHVKHSPEIDLRDIYSFGERYEVHKTNTGTLIIPVVHTKRFAVAYLLNIIKQKSPLIYTIGAGNAKVDYDFMSLLDISILAQNTNPNFNQWLEENLS